MNMLNQTLDFIERKGNRLPNPTVIFIYLCGVVLLVSWLSALFSVSTTHPTSGDAISARSLISADGLHFILTSTVKNFTQFAPVGSVLVAILGIAIAEHSGLIGCVLRRTVMRAPKQLTTFFVVLTGVLSSLALDTGYVVLIPLAAIIYLSMGRNPLAGIVAAFAGVSGGFSANIIVGPVDAILAGLSEEAAHLIAPDYQVAATGNYYFIAVSTLLIAVVGTFVTERIVIKWLPDHEEQTSKKIENTPFERIPGENKGLLAAAVTSFIFIALILVGLLPESGALRDPETGSILKSPFIQGIVVLISLFAGVTGVAFAKFSDQDIGRDFFITAMEKHMSTMSAYIVLMFFAAQFVNYFNWSQLGSILAITGANLLSTAAIPKVALLIIFILMTAFLNLFIGSSSAKWALIAPIFVPMLLLNGISPEATQMAYRIGDSSTNIISPLMPYFGVVVAFAQQYRKNLGIGTLVSLMLPYSLLFLICWTILIVIWAVFNLPLGPSSPIFIN